MWGRIAGFSSLSRPTHFVGAARKMSTALKDTLVKAGIVKDVIDQAPDVQLKAS